MALRAKNVNYDEFPKNLFYRDFQERMCMEDFQRFEKLGEQLRKNFELEKEEQKGKEK